MGAFETAFSGRLQEMVRAEEWGATFASGPERRVYFGTDRLREWMQPDVWAQLEALPGSPTVLAEVDTSPVDLGHNVAKYLWWADGRGAFWHTPAILVSAFAMRAPKDYLFHERIAEFLGRLLCERVPGTTHGVVNLRADPEADVTAERLAELAFERVERWVSEL
jgi:hypothetical protein